MLRETSQSSTNTWRSDAEKAIAAGSGHLLAFNEPDLSTQPGLSSVAVAYKTFLSDLFGGGSVRLGSPAVTNEPPPMGLAWLSSFISACEGCQIDFVAVHWYDSATNVEYFKNYLQQVYMATGRPVWLTEFGASGSADEIEAFLETVIPWLDSQEFIQRYAYFMATDGLLNSGTGLSRYGTTYANA
jgi:Glycosyl hydrolase catalytic core